MNKKILHTNSLINEKSPYLLQHAHNPVNWFAWSSTAFEKAEKEDKPIFLSIGYSTCHWCHVMEKESFEDNEVAEILNTNFISIKVDREERPDIDNIYMLVCQMLSGSGGWPLTIFLMPDKNPFFAGTYFPKYSFQNRIGIIDLLNRIIEIWKNRRSEVTISSKQITEQLNQLSKNIPTEINNDLFERAFDNFEKRFDKIKGGFGNSPKFPTTDNLLFLLRFWKITGNNKALEIVTKTLTSIRFGGICDQLGFGYHRYSTDSEWLVPHFEKMLYDQALLAILFVETFQATKNNFFLECAKEIFDYVLRDMQDSSGGFYSAEDADSEGVEGKYYLWKYEDVIKLLDKENGKIFNEIFNIEKNGNYFDEVKKVKSGENILHLKNQIPLDLKSKIEEIRKKLFTEREKRIHPFKDDKILTNWNGLMIAALAKGGIILDDKKYINSAKKGADFVLQNMFKNNKLLRQFRDETSEVEGNIEDYSFFVWGLLELYESTVDEKYLEWAEKINNIMIDKFYDNLNGGFYFTSHDSEILISRQKEVYDGATPSGNSIALQNLIWLYKITGNIELNRKSESIIKTFASKINKTPSAFSQFLCSFYLYNTASTEIVIVAECYTEEIKNFIKTLKTKFIPNKVLLLKILNNTQISNETLKLLVDFKLINNKPTIYICKNFKCTNPTNNFEEAPRELN